LQAVELVRTCSIDMAENVRAFLGESCYTEFFVHRNVFDPACLQLLVAKMLGLLIIAGAFGVKVPQIMKIVGAKSVAGLALASTVLELVGYLVTLAYNYRLGSPFTAYGEYIFLVAQSLTILLLFYTYGKFSAAKNSAILLYIALYLGAAYLLLVNPANMVPTSLLANFQAATIPIFMASRIPQILRSFADKSTGQLAILTWGLNFLGAVARVFTSAVEIKDTLILASAIIGAFLNGIIVFQILYFGNKAPPQTRGKKQQ